MKIRYSYAILCMQELVDSLCGATIFSTLCANCGFFQVEIVEKDRGKSAFTSHHCLSGFPSTPFRLNSVPGTFQRAIYFLLTNVKSLKFLCLLKRCGHIFASIRRKMDPVRKFLMISYDSGMHLILESVIFHKCID